MPKKIAARRKNVDEAVRILNTTTGVNVPWAMILAGYTKKDTTDETVRRMIRRHLGALETKQRTPRCDAPTFEVQITANNSVLSPLTGGDDNDTTASTTGTTKTMGPTHPKPKRKQIRPNASAIQQSRIDDLAAKRHKSDVHKAAVSLFNVEKQKPDGMSIRQVHDTIMAKYETCPPQQPVTMHPPTHRGMGGGVVGGEDGL